MNKLLFVLLAVCLVSAHAFVKRDIPTAQDVQAQLTEIQNKLTELAKSLSTEAAKVIDPDQLKQKFSEFVDLATKAGESFKPAGETTPAPTA